MINLLKSSKRLHELAKKLEEQKRAFLPIPQYDRQINANNYQENNNF